jgi:hypothetical protein
MKHNKEAQIISIWNKRDDITPDSTDTERRREYYMQVYAKNLTI